MTYEYLDIEQTFFMWYRADGGYYWDDEAELVARPSPEKRAQPRLPRFLMEAPGTGPFIPSKEKRAQPPFLIETPESTAFIRSKVADKEPALFLKFAEVQPTKEGILVFANKYGMLTGGHRVDTPMYSYLSGKEEPPWKHGVATLRKVGDRRVYGIVPGEALSFWQEEIRDMAWTVQVWEWIENKDISALEKIIYWSEDGQGVHCVRADKDTLSHYTRARDFVVDDIQASKVKPPISYELWPLAAKDFHGEIFARFRPGDRLLPAQYFVQSRINRKLKEHVTTPRLLVDENNQLKSYLMPENLLAAMWLQFFQAVVGEKRFKRCEICGRWEDVTDKTKRWSKHSDCANRARVARSRAKEPKKRSPKRR